MRQNCIGEKVKSEKSRPIKFYSADVTEEKHLAFFNIYLYKVNK